jgi:hypothetical protein
MKTTLRNTITNSTEILGSHVERRDGKLFMITDVRHTARRYDGRGFAGVTETYQTLVLPLSQVEELHRSQVGTLTYYLDGRSLEDGDTLEEDVAHLEIRNVADDSFIAGNFHTWNEAREYVCWAKRLNVAGTGMWGLYKTDDPKNCIEYLVRVGEEQT